MKPSDYHTKTDWVNDKLMICKTCLHYADLSGVGCESCIHPEHYWYGTYNDGPDWNGVCEHWEAVG